MTLAASITSIQIGWRSPLSTARCAVLAVVATPVAGIGHRGPAVLSEDGSAFMDLGSDVPAAESCSAQLRRVVAFLAGAFELVSYLNETFTFARYAATFPFSS